MRSVIKYAFLDDYIFYGSRSEKNLQIGNAVPTFLSQAIKEAVKTYLQENDNGQIVTDKIIEIVDFSKNNKVKNIQPTLFD